MLSRSVPGVNGVCSGQRLILQPRSVEICSVVFVQTHLQTSQPTNKEIEECEEII